MKKSIWFIKAETNLHVGNENTSSVGLIDKEIQRDVLTGIPCINSSSLKGAMNEYATSEANLSPEARLAIFGVDRGNGIKETQKGGCLFFDAQLLLLPVQDDKKLYRLITCNEVLDRYVSLLAKMGIKYSYDNLVEALVKCGEGHFDKKTDIVECSQFEENCSNDDLPIIARNSQMGAGNLWYEQVLPHKSVFGTFLVYPPVIEVSIKDASKSEDTMAEPANKKAESKTVSIDMTEAINKTFDNKIVQIGANATIGYGYCSFIKVKEE